MNNPANQLITKKEVEDILNHFGNIGHNSTRLEINQLDHYQCAFVHETYFQAVQTMTQTKGSFISGIHFDYIPMESSQRLEFLGDNVLKAVLGRYLMERFGSEREGFLTRLKIKIENKDALYKIAVKLGFKKFLLLSLETENVTLLDIDRGRNTPSYYEDAFESFLGSILMDFGEHGYVYADRFFRGVLENVIDFADLISTNDNFKDSLQRFFQSNRWDTPSYKELKEPGESVPVYRQVFTSVLFVTVQQYETLDKASQKRISGYTQDTLESFKHRHQKACFEMVFGKIRQGHYVLAIGRGRKKVVSEQDAAKTGLSMMGLDSNY